MKGVADILSAVWKEDKDLFNELNNGTWPYTVRGENYVKHLSENYENRDFLMKKVQFLMKLLST